MSIEQAAYDRLAYFALRPELYFDRFATVKATRQAMPGASVIFTFVADLAEATADLAEATDVDAVALADSQQTLTLTEKGNAVITTAKLRATSFITVDPIAANTVGYNAGVSTDALARTALVAGTNVIYAGTATSRTTLGLVDQMDANDVRKAVAKLRGASAPTIDGSYVGIIHPDVSVDFREGTGPAGWLDPANYSDASRRWNGEIGKFEGVRFIEAPRSPLFVNASNDAGAAGTIDVYAALVFGAQALAKGHAMQDGYGPSPQIVLGPVTDKLMRFKPVGWKHLVAYGIFRQACVQRIESVSTLGNNTS